MKILTKKYRLIYNNFGEILCDYEDSLGATVTYVADDLNSFESDDLEEYIGFIQQHNLKSPQKKIVLNTLNDLLYFELHEKLQNIEEQIQAIKELFTTN